MSNFQRCLALAFLSVFITATCGAQQIQLAQTNETGIYKTGEQVIFTANLEGVESDSIVVEVRKNYSFEVEKRRMANPGGQFIVFSELFKQPSAVIVKVSAGENYAELGAVINPEKFEPGTKRPEDFDRFWTKEKEELQALPMKLKKEAVSTDENGYNCWDVEINSTVPKPARGYFAKPENAKEKSLPIVLYVHAAGVKGSWCLSRPEEALRYAKMGNGALAFDLNAHGMLNGEPQEYYGALEEGELKEYWKQGAESRDEYYFKGMYLRLMRTLDFLTNQPEWDGKRILVIGESQGGGQALAAAGLDHRVSAVVATVPAMSNMVSHFGNAIAGWPNPMSFDADSSLLVKTIPYFDTAHLLKGSTATIVTEIGLIDVTCPSYAIYAAINKAEGKKITYAVPYRGHHLSQHDYQGIWEENVYQSKQRFIKDFLK
ncbi:acetylxylan esterase [Draconibacterium sp. IB214405]|uniref:acetylxylan esterase n=1 Tax=Draconibacterium sp. IB214405 TaxID=3097352 RepID=UPI002A0C8678|nr:acetylxylan esterase [Draconibacterium sp. IB214405]MDX8338732.1 acetylxylan esterase [Draconibacterium sp. IB214405]